MKKKVLSVLLSTAMIASVLAGCGGGGTESAPAADSGSAGTEAQGRKHRRQTAAARRRPRRILRQAEMWKRLHGCSGMT